MTTAVMEQQTWSVGPASFRYQLGDVVLFRRTFTAMLHRTHFTAMPVDGFAAVPDPSILPAEADAVMFRSAPASGPLKKISREAHYIRYVPNSYHRYYVDLNGSFDDYLKKFTSKSRSTLLRKVRKFSEQPGARWHAYRNPSELQVFLDLAARVSAKTYQERLMDAGIPTTPEYREHVLALAERGSAIGAVLFLGDAPVSYIFSPAQDGVLLYEYVGFDPEYRELSPGTVLQYYLLQQLFSDREFRIFDFTEGEGQHKAFFATHNVYCADVYFFRRTLWNYLTIVAHAGVNAFSSGLGKFLDKLKVKSAIKKFLRK